MHRARGEGRRAGLRGQRIPSTLSRIESLLFVHFPSISYMSAEHLSYFIILCCLVIIFSLGDLCASLPETDEKVIYDFDHFKQAIRAKKAEHNLPNHDCQYQRRKTGKKWDYSSSRIRRWFAWWENHRKDSKRKGHKASSKFTPLWHSLEKRCTPHAHFTGRQQLISGVTGSQLQCKPILLFLLAYDYVKHKQIALPFANLFTNLFHKTSFFHRAN